MYLILLCTAWIAGIFLGSILDIPFPLIFTGLTPLLIIPFIKHHRKAAILTGLCLIAFFSGSLRYNTSLPPNDETSLVYYNDQGTVELTGMVDRDPEQKEKSTQLHFAASEIKMNGKWQEISGTALIYVPLSHQYPESFPGVYCILPWVGHPLQN